MVFIQNMIYNAVVVNANIIHLHPLLFYSPFLFRHRLVLGGSFKSPKNEAFSNVCL